MSSRWYGGIRAVPANPNTANFIAVFNPTPHKGQIRNTHSLQYDAPSGLKRVFKHNLEDGGGALYGWPNSAPYFAAAIKAGLLPCEVSR